MVKEDLEYLYGSYVTLKPINSALHAYMLYENLNHPKLWDFFYSRPYTSFPLFQDYIRGLERQQDRNIQNYAICNEATGEALGFLGIDDRPLTDLGSVQIVNVMFSLKLQKTTMATEAFYLAAEHCFERLGCDQLEWRCDLGNDNSFRAAQRFGFFYDGEQPDHGRRYNFFYMIRPDWQEAIKPEYCRWLKPSNFDSQGKQKSKLELRTQ